MAMKQLLAESGLQGPVLGVGNKEGGGTGGGMGGDTGVQEGGGQGGGGGGGEGGDTLAKVCMCLCVCASKYICLLWRCVYRIACIFYQRKSSYSHQ